MTRRPPVRLLSGAAFLVLLPSCAGSGTGVDSAADAASAAASATTTAGSTGGSAPSTPENRPENTGNAGVPGGDRADGAGEGGTGARPGAPGDVAVFEEGGDAPYSALVDDAATKCAHGACTLLEPPIILDGDVHRVEGGVGACTIAEKTDILYDPPAKGGRFPTGATVRAQVHCADVETPVEPPGSSPAGTSGQEPANPDAGKSDAGNSSAGNSAGGTTTSGTADQPQG